MAIATGRIGIRIIGTLGLGALVSACSGATAPGWVPEGVSRFAAGGSERPARQVAEERDAAASRSALIAGLSARQSVLVPGTPYAEVARAVMASDARVAEAELRVAELRESAAARNWLPTLGPSVSLTSLGDVVTDLVLNQVLFDNGRRRAERDLARAEAEAAAVRLAQDGNDRVRDGLLLYLRGLEARRAADHFATAHVDMAEFERVMSARAAGGVANPSDLTVLRQKLADIAADRDRARSDANRAEAELAALADGARPMVAGTGTLGPLPEGTEPLSVAEAEALRARAMAEADMARAGHLPGLGVSARSDGSGVAGGLRLDTAQALGLGTGASLAAIEATREAAERVVTDARATAARDVAALRADRDALVRQAGNARALVAQARSNLDLFQRQYEGGGRTVMELVGVYESYASAAETAIALDHRALRAEIELAHRLGVLFDGRSL
ncbi:outer membrane protein, adhesin transport system [Roseivivax marinus]|uniref:TolC family protein n=1 Tax=Roseivivax marinus TaxID=1379903 RepID=UPI0008C1D941|nr:TolC family protein [Roseivivax marinus]SEK60387.1 outer membrane protein, adhesin transport system [Roseivivax marinus]